MFSSPGRTLAREVKTSSPVSFPILNRNPVISEARNNRLRKIVSREAIRTVAAVYDRRYFLDSRKNRRSQSAATVARSEFFLSYFAVHGVGFQPVASACFLKCALVR